MYFVSLVSTLLAEEIAPVLAVQEQETLVSFYILLIGQPYCSFNLIGPKIVQLSH